MVYSAIPYTKSFFSMESRAPRWVYILFTVIGVFLIWPLWPLTRDVYIQYKGHKAIATVTEVPLTCRRKYPNVIKILLDKKERRLDISYDECKTGKYQVGQQVALLVHPSSDKFIEEGDRADYMLVLYLAALVFLFFILRYTWIWLKKKVRQ